MKNFAVLGCGVALLLSWSAGVASAQPDVPHVTVFGTAVTEVEPNELRWHLTVWNQGADVAKVAEEHSARASTVLRFLRTSGVQEKHVQTAHMNLAEHREMIGNSWVKQGYRAQTQIVFRTQNVAGYRDLWLGLARLDGVTVEGVHWEFTERPRVQQSTRVEALRAARAKAAEMVAVLKGRLAEPLVIEEIPEQEWGPQPFNRMMVTGAAESADEVPLAAGRIPIKVRVKVSFRVVAD